MKRVGIITLIVINILISILFVSFSLLFPQHPDVTRLSEWARISHLYGAEKTYHKEFIREDKEPNNLPPATIYTLTAIYKLDLMVTKAILRISNGGEGSILWINLGYLNFIFLRIPAILSNIAIGILIYKTVKKLRSKKPALVASSLYLFNPIVLYNSAFWGQIDSLNILFFVLGLVLFVFGKNFLSVLSIFLSLFYKLSILPLLPFFALLFYKSKRILRFSLFSFVSFCILTILSFPISSSPSWLFDLFRNTLGGQLQLISANAFNFWWIVFHPKSPSLIPEGSFNFFHLSLNNWGYIIFGIAIIPIVYLVIKNREKFLNPSNIFLILSLISLLFFLFLPKMHERYLFPFFPLFALFFGLKRKGLRFFVALTLLHFFNLISSWNPFGITLLTKFVENYNLQWASSVLTLAIALILYIKTFAWFSEAQES